MNLMLQGNARKLNTSLSDKEVTLLQLIIVVSLIR